MMMAIGARTTGVEYSMEIRTTRLSLGHSSIGIRLALILPDTIPALLLLRCLKLGLWPRAAALVAVEREATRARPLPAIVAARRHVACWRTVHLRRE